MSNINPTSAKKVSETKKVSEIKKTNLENLNLDSINFDKIEKNIKVSDNVKEKSKSAKKEIYKNKPSDKNKHKSFRQQMRTKRMKFENNIQLYYKENQNENLKKELKNFLEFYKSEYVLNDFSVYSLVDSNTDTDKLKDTETFLKIVKQLLSI